MSKKVSQAEIARVLGVSQPAVSGYIKRGMPQVSVHAALDWVARNKGVDSRPRQHITAQLSTPTPIESNAQTYPQAATESYDAAKTRATIAQADSREFDNRVKAGQYMDAAATSRAVFTAARALKDSLHNLDDRITASPEVKDAIRREIASALEYFATDLIAKLGTNECPNP
ncbi:MAG: hypothetical protein ACKO0Z_17055 [Betaproteobacteria bacterium]